ncbi:hypothetical protein ACFLZV_07240 [Candidatus Margulisiibacteriota bacterium]
MQIISIYTGNFGLRTRRPVFRKSRNMFMYEIDMEDAFNSNYSKIQINVSDWHTIRLLNELCRKLYKDDPRLNKRLGLYRLPKKNRRIGRAFIFGESLSLGINDGKLTVDGETTEILIKNIRSFKCQNNRNPKKKSDPSTGCVFKINPVKEEPVYSDNNPFGATVPIFLASELANGSVPSDNVDGPTAPTFIPEAHSEERVSIDPAIINIENRLKEFVAFYQKEATEKNSDWARGRAKYIEGLVNKIIKIIQDNSTKDLSQLLSVQEVGRNDGSPKQDKDKLYVYKNKSHGDGQYYSRKMGLLFKYAPEGNSTEGLAIFISTNFQQLVKMFDGCLTTSSDKFHVESNIIFNNLKQDLCISDIDRSTGEPYKKLLAAKPTVVTQKTFFIPPTFEAVILPTSEISPEIKPSKYPPKSTFFSKVFRYLKK